MIDRAGGGYTPCKREINHAGAHEPANRARIAPNAKSWYRLDQWLAIERLRIASQKRSEAR